MTNLENEDPVGYEYQNDYQRECIEQLDRNSGGKFDESAQFYVSHFAITRCMQSSDFVDWDRAFFKVYAIKKAKGSPGGGWR